MQARELFLSLGIETTFEKEQLNNYLFFAGTGDSRAKILHQYLTDPEIQGILCLRGGSGCIHLLHSLTKFDQSKWVEKPIVGFSDISNLLNHFSSHLNWITFHGHVAKTLGRTDQKEKVDFLKRLSGDWSGDLVNQKKTEIFAFQNGNASGRLLGGNLATLVSMIGTPWQVNFDNSILFLEDINEAPYEIERMISQLYFSKSLENIRGLILGKFIYNQKEIKINLLKRIMSLYFNNNLPMINQFTSGHQNSNQMLPIGAIIEMNTSPLSIRIVDTRLKT